MMYITAAISGPVSHRLVVADGTLILARRTLFPAWLVSDSVRSIF